MASDDPDFESKAANRIGLYLAPPQQAAVFCVHEKAAIQATLGQLHRPAIKPSAISSHRSQAVFAVASSVDFLSLFLGEDQRLGTKRHTSKALAQYL